MHENIIDHTRATGHQKAGQRISWAGFVFGEIFHDCGKFTYPPQFVHARGLSPPGISLAPDLPFPEPGITRQGCGSRLYGGSALPGNLEGDVCQVETENAEKPDQPWERKWRLIGHKNAGPENKNWVGH